MNGGILIFLLGLLASLLMAAAISDLRTREISNWLNGAIALLAIPFWLSLGLALWPDIALHIGVAVGLLFAAAILFHFGMMGGGDVKMLAAVALWLPPGSVLLLLVVMSIAGGVLTLVMLLWHWLRKPQGKIEIPYGVAIALGGLWVIAEPFLNHFA